MKTNVKIIMLLVILAAPYLANAQSETQNLIKYWYYRNRLQYFVVPGDGPGESNVAGIRNLWICNNPNSDGLDYSQHSAYLGYYIGVLATEYYLLNQHGYDCSKTLMELYYALKAYIEQMDKCESKDPWYLSDDLYDGFFMRNNVPSDFATTHSQELNKDIPMSDMGTGGNPGWVETVGGDAASNPYIEVMSQDEAIFLIQHLALVIKLVPDYDISFYDKNNNSVTYNFNSTAREIIDKIITFIHDSHIIYGYLYSLPWSIYMPNNQMPTIGGDAIAFQYGFKEALYKWTQHLILTPQYSKKLWNSYPYDWILFPADFSTISQNTYMTAGLAAIGNSWTIPVGVTIGICPCCCIQLEYDIPATAMGIKTCTKRYNWDTYYLMLWSVLQNKSSKRLSMTKVLDQLNSAPCEGPYYRSANDKGENGWACSAKFWHISDDQDNGQVPDFCGIFNGLDYMILYNLYHILNSGSCPPYENYNSRYLTGIVTNPNYYVAYDSLISTQTITNTIPTVDYKAGELIRLKPGFHAVHGSDFHAYIEQTGCSDNNASDQASIYPNYPLIAEDTIPTINIPPCLPSEYNTLQFNGIEFDTTEMFSYHWEFPSYYCTVTPNPDVPNPVVIIPDDICGLSKLCSLTFTDSEGNSNTVYFYINKECCDTSSSKSLLKITENDNAIKEDDILIYPNPANDILYIKTSLENYNVTLYNQLGQSELSNKAINGNTVIHLNTMKSGIYYLTISNYSSIYKTEKIMINK